MSATIMRYPMAYNDLVPELVRLITARLNPKPLPGYIKIGISFNFNK